MVSQIAECDLGRTGPWILWCKLSHRYWLPPGKYKDDGRFSCKLQAENNIMGSYWEHIKDEMKQIEGKQSSANHVRMRQHILVPTYMKYTVPHEVILVSNDKSQHIATDIPLRIKIYGIDCRSDCRKPVFKVFQPLIVVQVVYMSTMSATMSGTREEMTTTWDL